MKWKVLWVPVADRQLTDVRAKAPNPNLVEYAALDVERQLETDPQGVGESRDAGRRVLFVPPLGVLYRVHVLSRELDELRVWSTTKD